MNIIDLMARLNGEFLANQVRAIVDGKIVILARLNGHDWVYTDEGQALANAHSNVAAEEESTAKIKSAKKVAKESSFVSAPAVESSDVAPEL